MQTKFRIIDENSFVDIDELDEEMGLMGLRIKDQEHYLEIMNKNKYLNELNKDMQSKLSNINRPILMTEGKWDVKILSEAWNRLYSSKECPFKITTCDISPEEHQHHTGGADTLKNYLKIVLTGFPITIGLFDLDKKGYECFSKLDGSYFTPEGSTNLKLQTYGNSGAILLPVIENRRLEAEAKVFCIELYFDDEYLEKEVEGRSLGITRTENVTLINGNESQRELFINIKDDNKKHFVEKVVPTFPNVAFENFKILFDKIEKVIAKLQEIRNANAS